MLLASRCFQSALIHAKSDLDVIGSLRRLLELCQTLRNKKKNSRGGSECSFSTHPTCCMHLAESAKEEGESRVCDVAAGGILVQLMYR